MKIKMKCLWIMAALLISPFALADIELTAPVEYDSGEALPLSSIDYYVLCVAYSAEDTCDDEINIVNVEPNMVLTTTLHANTHHVKIKTVDIFGSEGIYSPMFYDEFRGPLPPIITFRITVEIN